jgi:hypothetical protein
MTLLELQAKREKILRSLGIARLQCGETSIEYRGQQDALAAIDREIAKLSPGDKIFAVQTKRGLE